MKPCRRRPPAASGSERVDEDETDRLDVLEKVEGVDVDRSREGQAPEASEGDVLGEGEAARRTGDVTWFIWLPFSIVRCAVLDETVWYVR